MNEFQVSKAQGIGDKTVASVCIVINEEVPNYLTCLGYTNEAKGLENALHSALPGAIYDRLLIAMLERTASSFIVSHNRDKQ